MARKWYIVMLFLGVFSYSCNSSEKANSNFTDSDVHKHLQQAETLVDSLVNARHPNPIAFLNSAERLAPTPNLTDLFIKYKGARHYYYEYQRDFDLTLQYADSTFRLFEERYYDSKYQMHYLYSVLTKADALKQKHLYGMSINHLLQGWQMIESKDMPCLADKYLGMLGSISYEQENYSKSINYYSQALETSSACKDQTDFKGFVNTYQYFQNVASNYSKLQMPDSALHYNNLSLNLLADQTEQAAESANQRFIEIAKGVALGNKASEVLELGRGEEAEHLWKESIRINSQHGFANEHARLMQLWLAQYYIESDRMKEARETLDSVRNWLDNHSSETGELRWSRINWQWFDKMGLHEQAYTAFQHYVELKQSANESNTELAALDLANQIQYQEQQQNIERLEIEAEFRDVYIIFISFISSLIIVILFLIWKNWKESKVRVQRLKGLNRTIAGKNNQLEESNKTITKIMHVVAHDLRSPLFGIREVSSLLIEDQQLSDERRNWARMIYQSSQYSMNLIKKILNLDFATFDLHSENLQKEPIELRSFLQTCVELLRMQANKKHQVIHLDADESITCFIDKDAITRVINNVVGNAIKFSPKGSAVFVRLEQIEETIKISIQDNGIGIPQEFQESVFDMFTETKRSGTDNEHSFGLGLSISKQIIEIHEGTIWFESDVSTGTTFYIELPAMQAVERKIK